MNTRKKHIYIPVEIKVRELYAKVLFSLIAAENGFTVVLGGQRALRDLLHKLPPGIYIDKSISVSKKRWFPRFLRLGHRIVAWDEEGLVIDEKNYLKSRVSQESFDLVDLFFTWGDHQKEKLLSGLHTCEGKIVSTGNPRIDILRPEIKNVYSDLVESITDKYGSIILINSNFGFHNHFKGKKEAKRLFMHSSSHANEEYIINWMEFQKQLFESFVECVPWLRKQFPDHTIIIRPHPSESEREWCEIVADLPGVEVTREGNALEWIIASDVIIHSTCTTGIEAYLLGVPTIAYRPVTSDLYESYLPNAVSVNVFSFNEFKTVLTDVLSGSDSDKYIFNADAGRNAARYISHIDGKMSSTCIVNELSKIDISYGDNWVDYLFRGYQVVMEKLRISWNSLRQSSSSQKNARLYDRQKFSGISNGEMNQLLDLFTKTTGRFVDIRIQERSSNCFVIERKL